MIAHVLSDDLHICSHLSSTHTFLVHLDQQFRAIIVLTNDASEGGGASESVAASDSKSLSTILLIRQAQVDQLRLERTNGQHQGGVAQAAAASEGPKADSSKGGPFAGAAASKAEVEVDEFSGESPLHQVSYRSYFRTVHQHIHPRASCCMLYMRLSLSP